MRILSVVAVTTMLTVLTPVAASATPPPAPHPLAWTLSFDDVAADGSSPAPTVMPDVKRPHPRASNSATRQAAADEDLKTECARHPEAQSDQGWAHSRFDQCFLRTDAHLTLRDAVTQVALAQIDFESSLLAFAYDGSRRIDYVFTFDDFSLDYKNYPEGAPFYNSTLLSVDFAGCGSVVVCSGGPTSRSELAPAWQAAASRTVQFSVTSDNDAGAGKFKIVHSLISMSLSAVTAFGNVLPYNQTLAHSRGRFDSALGALGGGKHWGAIMPDFVPTLVLDRSATSLYRQEAMHVYDALHNPTRTFPSRLGKSVPGQGDRPLHRLMDAALRTANNNSSRSVCQDVWGMDYTTGGLECDEYPFQSTYEGSFVSTGGNISQWNGSARPINGDHNGKGGLHLQAFYNLNRILDENLETDTVGPTDPFRVQVVG